MQPGMKSQMCCSLLCEVIDCLALTDSHFHLFLFKAVCCGEPLSTVLIHNEIFMYSILCPEINFKPKSVLRLYVFTILPLVWQPGPACLASSRVSKPLAHLW